MLKAVLFDLDDTLIWDKKSIKEAFVATTKVAEKEFSVDSEKLEKAVRDEARKLYSSYETYEFTQMIGINPFEGLWGDFLDDDHEHFQKLKEIVPAYRKEAWKRGLKRLGIEDERFAEKLANLFPSERKKNPFVYEETFRVLEALKGRYKLVLLTNGSPDLQNTKLGLTPELVQYFDDVIISGAFGRGKPDPSIFDHVLKKVNVKKEDALMVGDNLNTDIKGANSLGIKSVWINRDHKEKSDIEPDYEIYHLEELFPLLDSLDR